MHSSILFKMLPMGGWANCNWVVCLFPASFPLLWDVFTRHITQVPGASQSLFFISSKGLDRRPAGPLLPPSTCTPTSTLETWDYLLPELELKPETFWSRVQCLNLRLVMQSVCAHPLPWFCLLRWKLVSTCVYLDGCSLNTDCNLKQYVLVNWAVSNACSDYLASFTVFSMPRLMWKTTLVVQ